MNPMNIKQFIEATRQYLFDLATQQPALNIHTACKDC